MADKKQISQRKKDHLKIALSDKSQTGDAGFDAYRFVHNALPEIDFDEIDLSTNFLGRKVNYPFFISCMTGGAEEGGRLNKNLAIAAQKKGIAMGVGSQRAAVEHPELRATFKIREYAPDIPIIANVGLVQLNYGFGIKEIEQIIEMVDADAIAFHINPIQEVIQPEGDRNFKDLLPKLKKILPKINVPVMVKEVGFGLSYDVIERLFDVGVRIFDTAGWGGTSWAVVEGERRVGYESLGELFGDWGIPTTDSIRMCADFRDKLSTKHKPPITIIGSGGVRNGIDMAKAIALGSDMVGVAMPFAKAGLESEQAVKELIDRYAYELRSVMFGVGARDIAELQETGIVEY